MTIDDKFFDEDRIIKRSSMEERVNENIVGVDVVAGVELTINDDQPAVAAEQDEQIERKQPQSVTKLVKRRPKVKQPVDKPIASKQLTDDELRNDILTEMIDKTRRQLVAKEVDIRVYQQLSRQATSTEMRNRCTSIYEHAIKELGEIRLRLKILIEEKQ